MRSTIFLLLVLSPTPVLAQATDMQAFFDLLRPDAERAAAVEQEILEGWDDSHAVMLVELLRFAEGIDQLRLLALLGRATGQSFGQSMEQRMDQWWAWIWRTNPGTHPDYAEFKAALYNAHRSELR